MSTLKNCKKCGKLFVSTGSMICSSCIEADRDLYGRITEYIAHRPNSTIFDVAEALDISVRKVLDLVNDGNLELRCKTINTEG